jgi:hypothetical protein
MVLAALLSKALAMSLSSATASFFFSDFSFSFIGFSLLKIDLFVNSPSAVGI